MNTELKKVNIEEYPNTVAENAKIIDKYKKLSNDIAKNAVNEFITNICKIPRKSGDNDNFMKYIFDWARNHKIDAKFDSCGCLYWDVPASPGCEDYPKIILQAHTDMVWSTKNDDIPYSNGVDVVHDEKANSLHSKDYLTTLGADDAHGVITIFELSIRNDYIHGPLRMLFTYDEETDMAGAINLNPEVLDADYIINLDGRQFGILRAGSSGCYSGNIDGKFSMCEPLFDKHLTISIGNLKGGHSANAIVYKRVSAIDVQYKIMLKLIEENINFNFVSLEGGQLKNVITQNAKLSIIANNNDIDKIKEIAINTLKNLMDNSDDDKNGTCNFDIENAKVHVFSEDTKQKILDTLNKLSYKLIDVREDMPYIGKTSNNPGVVKINNGELFIQFAFRYTEYKDFEDFQINVQFLKNKYSLNISNDVHIPVWPFSKDNKFTQTMIEAFQNSVGIDPIINVTHGYLECAYFSKKKPNTKCFSIGPDVEDEHGTHETFYLNSFPTHIATLLYMLEHFDSE